MRERVPKLQLHASAIMKQTDVIPEIITQETRKRDYFLVYSPALSHHHMSKRTLPLFSNQDETKSKVTTRNTEEIER